MSSHKRIWDDGVANEIEFWTRWFETKGLEWPQDYKTRLDPNLPLQENVREFLNPAAESFEILDVGAGPLTLLGKTWPGKQVRITATDALADEYDKIMQRCQVTPPVRTTWCHGELLSRRFRRNTFDLVWAENCVDHSYHPIAVIKGALEVVKLGAHVVLIHATNEAENEHYSGFHQWNFCERNGAFHIWNRDSDTNVTKLLSSRAKVHCRTAGSGVLVSIQKCSDGAIGTPPELAARWLVGRLRSEARLALRRVVARFSAASV
jgi:SAM-dependent methyltransferase